jgi:hypothetical protein
MVKVASGALVKISDRKISALERRAFPLDDFGNFLHRRAESEF